jgi:IS5 family transposase
MRHADAILADEELLEIVHHALQRRCPHSRTHGRPGTPAEVGLRMLLLKHVRDWSFADLERETRGNLLYREFTRIGAEKVPDAKTLGRLAQALGPEVIEKIQARIVALGQEHAVVKGRRMRLDTTVVETNIHHPTDSGLMGDGVRVLTRLMKKVTEVAGEGTQAQPAASPGRNWPSDSQQGQSGPGESKDGLSQTGGSHKPGCGPGKEVLRRNWPGH